MCFRSVAVWSLRCVLAQIHVRSSLPKRPPTKKRGVYLWLHPRFESCIAERDGVYRLDAMHEGITGFLGGGLTLANLGNPKRILEVGWVVLGPSCPPFFPERNISPGQGAALGLYMPRRIILMPRSSQLISPPFPNGEPSPTSRYPIARHLPAP